MVHRDREADSGARPHRCRVDPDHQRLTRDQWAAGVARVDRRIGLDDVVDQAAGDRSHRATQRGDDAGGDRGMEAVRAADGQNELAHAKLGGIAELGGRKTARVRA